MEEDSPISSDASTALQASSPTDHEQGRASLPPSLNLNELQALTPEELDELCHRFDLRILPGRNRHQQILELVRCALSRQIPVSAEGFFDQTPDSFALLRFPALNFLPVPEEVGVP